MKYQLSFLLTITLMSLLLSSCKQQYFYLNKVRASSKKGPFTLQIINLTPNLINTEFEAQIKDAAIKKLIRQGHAYKPNNPQYKFVLTIKVDSVISSGIAYVGASNVGRAIPMGNYYQYTRNSRGVYLNVETQYLKTNKRIWEMDYDLYYFAQENRDRRRTKGVVRYMMGQFKHK